MTGETNLAQLIKGMTPELQEGTYVFVRGREENDFDREDIICEFREKEGITLVVEKSKADKLNYTYEFTASWITLMIHSSLEAVGLTAIVSSELAKNYISCNVIAAYYHDHIFVDQKDAGQALDILTNLSLNYE